jgi:hypothetical protein
MRRSLNLVLAVALLVASIGMIVLPIANGEFSRMWLYSGGVLAVVACFWLYEDFIAPQA